MTQYEITMGADCDDDDDDNDDEGDDFSLFQHIQQCKYSVSNAKLYL